MSDLETKGYEILTNEIDICFSPDDEDECGRAYFLQYYPTDTSRRDCMSDLYSTRAECVAELDEWTRAWKAAEKRASP